MPQFTMTLTDEELKGLRIAAAVRGLTVQGLVKSLSGVVVEKCQCAVCGKDVDLTGKRRAAIERHGCTYCGDTCRVAAHRKRKAEAT